jgi:hypothetical protein
MPLINDMEGVATPEAVDAAFWEERAGHCCLDLQESYNEP